MALPSLLHLPSEDEYKQYFVQHYCNESPIATFDGLPVMFFPEMFEHAFYKRSIASWHAPKDSIDFERCKRMPWIKSVIQDPSIPPHVGFDKGRHRYDDNSRVAFLAPNNYVVVIRKAGRRWKFVTAYIVDNEYAATKIAGSPLWTA